MRRLAFLAALLILVATAVTVLSETKTDSRLKNAFRKPQQNGWTFVHLEGTPSEIGYQHGYLLADLIKDGIAVQQVELTHNSNGRDWNWYRDAAKNVLWPHIEQEYREELEGLAAGIKAKGITYDLWDLVAENAMVEWSYYTSWYDKQHGRLTSGAVAEHCSAFVATGSYTKDGRPVIAHNNWSGYLDGQRWTIIFDIKPVKGYRFIMDGYPGVIHSADDFGINSAGIMITETTITGFKGWDPNGIPEMVRARKAMQYAASVDDFARIMREGNNGGYANDWLVADRKNNGVASLELGLKNVTLNRTKDGYFVGSNFPINPKLAAEETDFDVNDMSLSANARHKRWNTLMEQNKGKIDVKMAERFLGDHFDTFENKEQANERTLCGHVDLSSRGMKGWQAPYGIAGAVQNKVTDAALAEKLTLVAHAGHACGLNFKATDHLKKHPEFNWEAEYLHDMNARPWTTFAAVQ